MITTTSQIYSRNNQQTPLVIYLQTAEECSKKKLGEK